MDRAAAEYFASAAVGDRPDGRDGGGCPAYLLRGLWSGFEKLAYSQDNWRWRSW